ncbi:hypothetical protein AAVH_09175 [Aphelenchoides avenae]|nr:hypothetical protein AAVH_09175 [Aphelenchus avenae]
MPSPSPGLDVATTNVLEVDLEFPGLGLGLEVVSTMTFDLKSESDLESVLEDGLGLGFEVATMRGHVLEDGLIDSRSVSNFSVRVRVRGVLEVGLGLEVATMTKIPGLGLGAGIVARAYDLVRKKVTLTTR